MKRKMFRETVTINEAKKIINSYSEGITREKELVNYRDALDRLLAENVVAKEDIPGFSRSTVDGFAVNSKDTFGASSALPCYLEIIGEVEMGESPAFSIETGQTVKIATGGMLPDKADAVVMLEDTEGLDTQNIEVFKPVTPGENVILKGEDYKKGEEILSVNHRLRAQDLGALAAAGISEIPVFTPVKVGIISTGDELVPPNEELVSGKIRDINTYTLLGLVKQEGGIPFCYGIVKDYIEELTSVVGKALQETDLVVLSGGSSVGAKDYTLKIIENFPELSMLFDGISIRPGKPTIAAAGSGKIFFGLPGNPVSAAVVFDILIAPLVSGLEIKPEEERMLNTVKAEVTRSISSLAGREDHIRVKLVFENDRLYAEPILGKSALISTLTKSDGEIIIPMGKEGVEAFQEVDVRLFGRRI